MTAPHLILDKVSVLLGGTLILDQVSLTVSEREFVCVIGTSGGGKTTLLRTIAGLLPTASGSVSLGGTPVLAPTPRTAMVFQHFGLFPWKTVRANVAYGLQVQGRPEALGRVQRLLDAFHLSEVADHYPAQLSGGMKQRAGMARALAVEPELLLLDEPFSSVDAITREASQNEVLQLWERTQRMTALLVTHDIDEAIVMADRIIVISGPPQRRAPFLAAAAALDTGQAVGAPAGIGRGTAPGLGDLRPVTQPDPAVQPDRRGVRRCWHDRGWEPAPSAG